MAKSRLSIPPLSRDTLSQACARALSAPVIVTDIGDGALLVEPLHFHHVVANGRGRVKISPFHVDTTTQKAG